jgi:glycosyltransferase involved in cell wall biosynthesis
MKIAAMTRERSMTDITLVGLIHRSNDSPVGGAPVVMVNLANHFIHRGFEVEVLVFTKPGVTKLPFAFHEGVVVHLLDSRSRWGLFLRIARHVWRSRPKAVLTVGNKANELIPTISRLPGMDFRFLASLHHNLSSEMEGWPASKRARRIRSWNRILAAAHGLIAVSKGVAEGFVRVTGADRSKVHSIYNPIVHAGLDAQLRVAVKHPWLDEKGSPVILGVGRLTEQKDFATLIRAFAEVRARRDARLIVIGGGEERESLTRLVDVLGFSEWVDLAGFKPNPLAYMQAVDLVVMSSRWEGFGNVLVEALYCGTPVVSTDCPEGPREVLADGEFGRLVPVADHMAMASAILAGLDDRQNTECLRARAMAFTVEASGDRYLDHLGLAPNEKAGEG